MIGIPSTSFGVNELEIPFDEGVERLVDNVGIGVVVETVNGMLFALAARDLPQASTPQEQLICHAKSLVLRDLQGLLVSKLQEQQAREEERYRSGNGY